MIALADSDADELCAGLLTRALLPLVPVEHRGALVQGLLDEGAGHRALVGTDLAVVVRRIDLADLHAVNLQFARSLVDHGLDGRDQLVLAWPPLWSAQRRVGQDGNCAESHSRWLIAERQRIACRAEVATADIRAILLNDVEIGAQQPSVLAEAKLGMALKGRTRSAEGVLL